MFSENTFSDTEYKSSDLSSEQQNTSGLAVDPWIPVVSHKKWHVYYEQQILDLYDILAEILDERYDAHGINWRNNEKILTELSKLIYRRSSKHLIAYL